MEHQARRHFVRHDGRPGMTADAGRTTVPGVLRGVTSSRYDDLHGGLWGGSKSVHEGLRPRE